MESKIVLQDIEKAYGKDAPVIEDLNLEIEEGSFTVLLGTFRLWQIYDTAYDRRIRAGDQRNLIHKW